MPRVIVTLQVEDAAKWEEGFRTHAALFRKQTISQPIQYAIRDGNEVVVAFEPEDLDTYLQVLDSPEAAEAMAYDGVKRETVKITVLDNTFEL